MDFDKDEEIIARGCNPVSQILIPDEHLIDLAEHLSSLPMAKTEVSVSRMRLKDILYDARTFLDENFKLHKIPSIRFYNFPFKKFVAIKDIHPYKLPLKFIKDAIQDGYVQEYFPPNRSTVHFESIAIGKITNELSSPTYVHEITHTQLNSLKGSIKDFFNIEVLSIFLELIHASEISKDEDILRIEEANRIYEIHELVKQQVAFANGEIDLSREDQIDNSKCIQSDLIAFKLFSIYYLSHYTIQREMLKKVQDVFNGLMTVEDFLEYFGVTFENSQNKNDIQNYLYRVR